MKLTTKLALSTCLVSFVGLSGSAFANGLPAADCCDQVAELDKRVKRLEDKAVEGDTKKIIVTGNINRAVTWLDDGVQSNTAHVNNTSTPSRLRIEGTAAYNDDVTFGLRTAFGLDLNRTANNRTHQAQTAGGAESNITVRRAEVFMTSKKFGTITAGHGYTASFATHFGTELTKAWNISLPYLMVNTPFRNKAVGNAASLSPIFVFNPGDSSNLQTRADRIQYDTPTWYGLKLQASHGYHNRGDLTDVAAKWAGKFGGWILATNAHFARNETREAETGLVGANGTGVKFDNVAASAAVLAPFSITGKDGTGIMVKYDFAHRDYKGVNHKDGRVHSGKLAYMDMFTDMGKTVFQGGYGQYRNMTLVAAANQTVKGTAWNVGVQQNIDKVGTELYASYANLKLKIKNTGQKYHDVDVVLVGARVKF